MSVACSAATIEFLKATYMRSPSRVEDETLSKLVEHKACVEECKRGIQRMAESKASYD